MTPQHADESLRNFLCMRGIHAPWTCACVSAVTGSVSICDTVLQARHQVAHKAHCMRAAPSGAPRRPSAPTAASPARPGTAARAAAAPARDPRSRALLPAMGSWTGRGLQLRRRMYARVGHHLHPAQPKRSCREVQCRQRHQRRKVHQHLGSQQGHQSSLKRAGALGYARYRRLAAARLQPASL